MKKLQVLAVAALPFAGWLVTGQGKPGRGSDPRHVMARFHLDSVNSADGPHKNKDKK